MLRFFLTFSFLLSLSLNSLHAQVGFQIQTEACDAQEALISTYSYAQQIIAAADQEQASDDQSLTEKLKVYTLPRVGLQFRIQDINTKNQMILKIGPGDENKPFHLLATRSVEGKEPEALSDEAAGQLFLRLLEFRSLLIETTTEENVGLHLAPCKPGICSGSEFRTLNQTISAPELQYRLSISTSSDTERSPLTFDLSQSMLGRLYQFQKSLEQKQIEIQEERTDNKIILSHPYVPAAGDLDHSICMSRSCTNATEPVNIASPDFRKLQSHFSKLMQQTHSLMDKHSAHK